MTAQLESVAAVVEAAGGIAASSSGSSSGILSTSRFASSEFRNVRDFLRFLSSEEGTNIWPKW